MNLFLSYALWNITLLLHFNFNGKFYRPICHFDRLTIFNGEETVDKKKKEEEGKREGSGFDLFSN